MTGTDIREALHEIADATRAPAQDGWRSSGWYVASAGSASPPASHSRGPWRRRPLPSSRPS